MAVTTALIPGKNARIYVSLTGVAADAIIIQSMNSISKRKETTSDTTPTFDDSPAPTASSVGQESLSVGGLFRPGQVGQKRVRDASDAGTTVYFHIFPDGETGFVQPYSVGGGEWSAAPGPLQPWSFEATAIGAAVAANIAGYAGANTGYTI